jgi:general secretion pathway protein K
VRPSTATRRPAALAAAPRKARQPRGAALLVVIVSTAILTAIAVDLAYSTRVSLLTAANSRDELRAEYLARSGVQFSRLVLKLQKQLDDAVPAGAAVPRVQIWSLVPITSTLTDGIFGAQGTAAGAPGAFAAKLEDEGTKVNAQLDGLASITGAGLLSAQVESLAQLIGGPQWDPLFEREDVSGQRFTRADVAIHLRDWTDPGSTGSALSANPAKPFEDGFGDENQPYSRYDPPNQTKNARFDSLDELYLVAGIDDEFMAAFGSRLTVYPDVNGLINVNTPDPDELVRNARVMADPPQQPKLADPLFGKDLLKVVSQARQSGLVTITPRQFAQIVQSFGVAVRGVYLQDSAQGIAFTDRSLVYRIRATGSAGAVERQVDAVVSFDPRQNKEQADTGRLLHWREE